MTRPGWVTLVSNYTRHRHKLRFLYGGSDHECTATNARDATTT